MRVALVGLPRSGKSTLFSAIGAVEGSHLHLERADQEHLAVAKVPEERVAFLEQAYKAKKRTYAEIEFLDVPGLDLSDESARERARTHWPGVRQSDLIALVVRNFRNNASPPYRDRVNVEADLDEILAEMLFSDLEQVTARIDKLQGVLKKPSPAKEREAKQHELALFGRLQAALESEKPLTSAIQHAAEEKIVRSFAFLTLKPLLIVINCDESALPQEPPARIRGYDAVCLSAKLELELGQLEPSERADFMKELGLAALAHDRLVRTCCRTMNLITFLTVGEKEARAWLVPAGTDAVTAAGDIHTDLARGFIRAEVVAFQDFKAAGSEKAAKTAGKYRLEGKNYLLKDGDVVLFKFNV